MEEVEKIKETRIRKGISKDCQTMTAITSNTVRGIIKIANGEGIKKENILSLLKENSQFILVYFK